MNPEIEGKRIYPDENGEIYPKPGEYGLDSSGILWAFPPKGCDGPARINWFWNVTEHENGTITVSQSIIVGGKDRQAGWHGYLREGRWREC